MFNENNVNRYQFRNQTVVNTGTFYKDDIIAIFGSGLLRTIVVLSGVGVGKFHDNPYSESVRPEIDKFLSSRGFLRGRGCCWNINDDQINTVKTNATNIGWPSLEAFEDDSDFFTDDEEEDNFEEEFAKAQEVEQKLKEKNTKSKPVKEKEFVWKEFALEDEKPVKTDDRVLPKYTGPLHDEEEYNPARSRYKKPEERDRSGIGRPSRTYNKKVEPNYIPPSEF